MKLMKGEPYQLSLTAVTEHAEVIELVGNPIIPSWYVLGSVHTSGPDGSAALEYSIEGSVASGKVYAYATKIIGEWHLDTVVVSVNQSNKRITVISARE